MKKFEALLPFAHVGPKKFLDGLVEFNANSMEEAMKICEEWPGTKKDPIPLLLREKTDESANKTKGGEKYGI